MSGSSVTEEKCTAASNKQPSVDIQEKKAPSVDFEEDSPNVAVYEVHDDKTGHDVFDSDDGKGIRRMNWKEGAVVAAKSQVGIGILGIPGTFGVLGFVPGLISLVLLCSIASLSAVYIAKIRVRYPQIHSVGDFGYMVGGRIGAEIFGWSYCIVFILFAGSAVQTLTIAFNAITSHGLCTMAFAGIVTAFVCVIGSFIHELERVAILSYLGLATVIIANWILTIAILVKGHGSSRPAGSGNDIQAAGSYPFKEEINAVSTQLFALMGVPSFFSISAEMETPSEFLKSVAFGQGFVVVNYVLIAVLVYSRAGKYMASPVLATAGHTFKIICYAIALFGLFVSCLLMAHIGGKYIFVRLLRGTRHLAKPTKTHFLVWAACFCGVLIVGFILACAVPVFGDLVSLIGALTGGFLIVGLTGIMGLFSLSVEAIDLTTGEKITPRGKGWIQRSWNSAWHQGTWKAKLNYVLSWVLMLAGLFITAGGTYGAVSQIITDSKGAGAPFSCADNSV